MSPAVAGTAKAKVAKRSISATGSIYITQISSTIILDAYRVRADGGALSASALSPNFTSQSCPCLIGWTAPGGIGTRILAHTLALFLLCFIKFSPQRRVNASARTGKPWSPLCIIKWGGGRTLSVRCHGIIPMPNARFPQISQNPLAPVVVLACSIFYSVVCTEQDVYTRLSMEGRQ